MPARPALTLTLSISARVAEREGKCQQRALAASTKRKTLENGGRKAPVFSVAQFVVSPKLRRVLSAALLGVAVGS